MTGSRQGLNNVCKVLLIELVPAVVAGLMTGSRRLK